MAHPNRYCDTVHRASREQTFSGLWTVEEDMMGRLVGSRLHNNFLRRFRAVVGCWRVAGPFPFAQVNFTAPTGQVEYLHRWSGVNISLNRLNRFFRVCLALHAHGDSAAHAQGCAVWRTAGCSGRM